MRPQPMSGLSKAIAFIAGLVLTVVIVVALSTVFLWMVLIGFIAYAVIWVQRKLTGKKNTPVKMHQVRRYYRHSQQDQSPSQSGNIYEHED